MGRKLTFRATLLSGVCMLPFGAMADDLGAAPAVPAAAQMTSEDEIDLGLGGIWGANTGQYGRYNGFTEEGLDGLFSFNSVTRKDTQYYIFTGSGINFQFGDNLGRAPYPCAAAALGQCQTGSFKDSAYTSRTANDLGPNAEAKFEVGDQGKWGVIGYYDAISYTGNIIDSIYTINGNQGILGPGLTKWGGATSPSAPTPGVVTSVTAGTLASAEQRFQTGTRRDIVGLTGTYTFGDWTITGALRHEHKEGTVEESFGEGALVTGQAFTLPVDYDTDRYDVSATYRSAQLQAVFGYFLSNFTDHNNGVFLPEPVGRATAPYEVTSLYATPPSNYAQYMTAMLAYNIRPTTRVNVNARYGLETQNDTFPANTGDPLASTIFPVLNSSGQGTGSATSPNIWAQVYQGNVGVTDSSIKNLTVSAKYSIEGRDVSINSFNNKCGGATTYAYAVCGNGQGSDTSITGIIGYVVPQDWLKQKVNLDADYRILGQSNTRVFANYEFDDIDRSNAQVGRSWTDTGTLGVSSMLASNLQGRVTGTLGERSGVVNFWEAFTNLGEPPGSTTYKGDPSIAFYQAPYTMEAANARLDYAPPGPLSGGLSFKFENDNYQDGAANAPGKLTSNFLNENEGIKQDYNLTAGVDGNYRPTDSVNLHAFYSFERIYFNNVGNGACALSNTGACAGSAYYFQNLYTNDVHTVGASVEWKATDRLKFTIEESFAFGDVMFGEYNGVFAISSPQQTYQAVSSYPNEPSVMNQLSAKVKYQLTDNVELGLGAGWAMFHMNNWQDSNCAVMLSTGVCGAGSAISATNLTPGYLSPNYNVGMVMAMLKIKW
ncbi:MAG: MtrB/PioB family outer membrane beta-barrel protein [Roseiarcus sp.]|jgi:MtrB/PioB family decaheme-associated outer membrane protein